MVWWLWAAVWAAATTAVPLPHELDSEQTRKLLGESVVTSVSVIMDHGNGTRTYVTDQLEDKKPQVVGTPGTLLAPDRYEFYSFGEDGELVKKLMSLDQIQSLIAGGSEADELEPLPVYYPQPLVDSSSHTEGVTKVLETVQNLLRGELQATKGQHRVPPVPLPDHSWSILLPGLLNSDLDYKEPAIPVRNDAISAPLLNNDLPSSKLPSTTLQPTTTTTRYTTPNRPSTQTSTFQKVVSTTQTPQLLTSTKSSINNNNKYSHNHITPSPYTKTTSQLVTKTQNQRPVSTTKKPYISTKKPYVSDSPYSRIPLINASKPETTTKPTTFKKPVISEERNPINKTPDSKKPTQEKQKPSGIPTITHYMPISSSSSSPSNASKITTPSRQETTTPEQKTTTPVQKTTTPGQKTTTPEQKTTTPAQKTTTPEQNTTTPAQKTTIPELKTTTPVTKEASRVTTTRRPTSKPNPIQSSAQKLTQTNTRKPVKVAPNKTNSTAPIKTSNFHKTTTKVTQKTPSRPTPAPQFGVKTQTKLSTSFYTTAPTTTKAKPEMTFAVTKPSIESTSTNYQLINLTKHTTSNPQKLVLTKKPDNGKPITNLVGQSSNIVNSKIKPSTATHSTTVMRPTTKVPPTPITTTTQPPERITTFSYTSKITSTGEIVTSTVPSTTAQEKLTTGPVLSKITSSPTQTTEFSSSKATEKPSEKVTAAHLESGVNQQSSSEHSPSSQQSTTGHSPSPPFQKPTTYHPQNFHASSKRPEMTSTSFNASSTSLTPSKTSETFQQLKVSTPISLNLENINSSSITTNPPSQTTSYSGIMTTVTMTKPTTEITPDGTTLSMTTSGMNIDTTHSEPSTFSPDDIPLEEIPLKIFESLKENVAGSHGIMTTIMSDNMPTTTGKIDSTYSTLSSDDTTFGSTLNTADKITTIISTTSGSTTLTPQTEKPVLKNSLLTESNNNLAKTTSSGQVNEMPEKESLQESASMPVEHKFNVSKINNTSTTTESAATTTTEPSNSSEVNNSETTTNMDTTTIYKDHILQEGISAVTSILLDDAQRQVMKEAMMASAALKDNQSKEKFTTTTENELTSTTLSDYTEMQTVSQNIEKDEMKSEVRLNEEAELPEKITTEKIETTTIKEKERTTPKSKDQSENATKQSLKKNEQKISPVFPTKESKLNPDSEPFMELSKIKPSPPVSQSEAPEKLRVTGAPEVVSSTPKVSEFQEKSVPKPVSTFQKKPAYQPLESLQPPAAIELHPAPYESMGLEASVAFLSEDVRRFADLCNELAFRMWTAITGKGQISSRSLVLSPFAVTSVLAMVFLGARGPTSGQMNDVLRLDDMVTFNPHQVLQNVTESVINSKNYGVATAAFVRELYSDKGKGKILDFYKERVQQYYQGHVEEVAFSMIGDIIRRRTNLLVKRQTLGKVPEYLRGSSLNMRPPLAAFSANIFQPEDDTEVLKPVEPNEILYRKQSLLMTDCEEGSTDGRDGEMYFVVRPSTRQRRLVPVPAVVWRTGFLAGYEPSLDATSVCLGAESIVSTILVLPGQQGQVAPGDGLARLEQRLIETSYRRGGWSRLLRSLMPRPGLELQVPRFSHRSVLNITGALQRMGLRDLFNTRADLRGLNGLSNDLHLSDMLQVNTFSTCGEETIGARHHIETYPASPQRVGREEQAGERGVPGRERAEAPLSHRPRQARLPDQPRLRFDRPFLYMVRHNPSGMILHMGRFNPRLLP